MKKLITTIALTMAVTSLTFAQGTVIFSDYALGSSAKVTEASGFSGAGAAIGNTAAGTASSANYFMQLYVVAGSVGTSSSLVAVGSLVNTRSGTSNSGYIQYSGTTSLGWAVDQQVTIPVGVLPTAGGAVTVQLRAWYNIGGTITSYADAVASSSTAMRYGASPLLYLSATGNPSATPPTTPVDLIGLSGFQLAAVPEPSTLALAGLGIGALLMIRRRK